MLNAIIRSAIAIAVAIFAGRQLVYGGRDLARYNKMREMSDDAPLLKPGRSNAATNAEARTKNPFVMQDGRVRPNRGARRCPAQSVC